MPLSLCKHRYNIVSPGIVASGIIFIFHHVYLMFLVVLRKVFLDIVTDPTLGEKLTSTKDCLSQLDFRKAGHVRSNERSSLRLPCLGNLKGNLLDLIKEDGRCFFTPRDLSVPVSCKGNPDMSTFLRHRRSSSLPS
jgi:hypothetical protein